MSSIALPALRIWMSRWFGRRHPETWPEPVDGSHVLAKAVSDSWTYAIGLKSGLLVHCSEVQVRGDWLMLKSIERVELPNGQEPLLSRFSWGRGMEVRISEVAFAADFDS
jgi:hypothetical protein